MFYLVVISAYHHLRNSFPSYFLVCDSPFPSVQILHRIVCNFSKSIRFKIKQKMIKERKGDESVALKEVMKHSHISMSVCDQKWDRQ